MAVIAKPDNAVLTAALHHAELLCESENDPHGLAHCLLYLAERCRMLETIDHAATAYVRSDNSSTLLAELVMALQALEAYKLEVEAMADSR